MKKKFLTVMLSTVLLTSLLVGCGDNTTTETSEVSTDTDATVSENSSNDFITTDEVAYEDLLAGVKLCDYKTISIDKIEKGTYTDEDIENEMKTFISQFDSYEHLTEGTAKDGDTVNVKFKGTINGEEFDGNYAEAYDITLGSGGFIEGFEDGIVGMNVGDTKTLNLVFPEDYGDENLNGKEVVFEVTLNYILGEKITAELTDEFLATNTEYKTVDELRTDITNYYENEIEDKYTVELENAVLAYLIDNCELPKLPQSMIDEYTSSMKSYYESCAMMYGVDFATFCNMYMGVTEETFISDAEMAAINYYYSVLILKSIANVENIELTETDIDEYIATYVETNELGDADEFKALLQEENEYDQMLDEILCNKVMTYLYENCVTETE